MKMYAMRRRLCRAAGAAGMALLVFCPAVGSARSTAVEAYLVGDYSRARQEWIALAAGGDAVARFNLGMLHLQGLGVPREPERAKTEFRAAAAAGYAPAQYQLGALALEGAGDGVEGGLEAARFWLTRAARQDHPLAAWQLGRLLAGDFGGVTDQGAAVEWLRRAESAGIDEAAQSLAAIEATLPGTELEDESDVEIQARLTEGRGTLEQRRAFFEGQKAFIRQDYAKAVEIWAPLAEAGVARAQYGIAFMLESGWGVVQDYAEAAYWYKLAAQKGHRKAQFNLGKMYLDGRGGEPDRGSGLYWIQTAADLGEPRAREYMDSLQ